MKAFVYFDSYSHLSFHERMSNKAIVKKRLIYGKDKDEIFHTIYGKNCSETYCYPRSNYRFVSNKLSHEFKKWEENGGIALYAKYNRMD